MRRTKPREEAETVVLQRAVGGRGGRPDGSRISGGRRGWKGETGSSGHLLETKFSTKHTFSLGQRCIGSNLKAWGTSTLP